MCGAQLAKVRKLSSLTREFVTSQIKVEHKLDTDTKNRISLNVDLVKTCLQQLCKIQKPPTKRTDSNLDSGYNRAACVYIICFSLIKFECGFDVLPYYLKCCVSFGVVYLIVAAVSTPTLYGNEVQRVKTLFANEMEAGTPPSLETIAKMTSGDELLANLDDRIIFKWMRSR